MPAQTKCLKELPELTKDILAYTLSDMRKAYLITNLHAYQDTYDTIQAFGLFYNKAAQTTGSQELINHTRTAFKIYITYCLTQNYIIHTPTH